MVLENVHYAASDLSPHLERGGRSLAYEHRVELHNADVFKVCTGDKIPDEQASEVRGPQSGGALTRGLEEAIEQVWLNGIIPKGLRAKDRNNMIIAQVRRNGGSVPKDPAKAIQRVLKKQNQNRLRHDK